MYTTSCDVEILRKRQNSLFIELIKYQQRDQKPSKFIEKHEK